MAILTFDEKCERGDSRVYLAKNSENCSRFREENRIWGDEKIYHIKVSSIYPNPMQPRKEFEDEDISSLAQSIAKYGILQPLTVRCITTGYRETYELVAGERRLRAAKKLSLESVPCLIINVGDRQSAELAIIENLQRKDLNIFEEASAISALISIYAQTQEQVAARLCVSQSYVANKLRILRLSEEEQNLILQNGLTERHARALLKITEYSERRRALDKIIDKKLNVVQSEEMIEKIIAPPPKKQNVYGKIKDMRIFYNTIDNALRIVRQSGVNVVSRRREFDDKIELTIMLKKPKTV